MSRWLSSSFLSDDRLVSHAVHTVFVYVFGLAKSSSRSRMFSILSVVPEVIAERSSNVVPVVYIHPDLCSRQVHCKCESVETLSHDLN